MHENQASALERVTAIVVTFNSAHCVPSLAQCFAFWPQVVVVDNGSQDGTAAEVGKSIPQARLVANGRNLGFGAANNRGVAEASTEFVLLVNPDCSCEAAAVAALVACADRHPDACLVGRQLVDAAGRVETTYGWARTGWASRGPGAEGTACVGFVSGACMLIRTAAMRQIGGFDESFFLYYEDDDLCLRLQRECGALVVEPAARVMHRSRQSVRGPRRAHAEFTRGYHHIQSKFRFHRKHLGREIPSWRRAVYFGGASLELLLRLLVLDRLRAARVCGRAAGILRYAGGR